MKQLLLLFASLLPFVVVHAETYVVCVGIATYADSQLKDLNKTENDAKAMAALYKIGTDNVITITGKYATKAQILKSLRSQFGRAGANDKIVFYFSGHGYPGGFCTYDMTNEKEGLLYADVINIMKESKAMSKFIFADACHSGSIRKPDTGATADPLPGNIVFFLSSRGNEYSIESSTAANGYFTKHLLRGLRGAADTDRNRKITASEIFQYVSAEVTRQTNGKQHPVMWGKFDDNLTIVEYKKK
ncbi:MAG: caspase family protein [Lachnospiraceae bacterium]|nr:caspase family protein [Lachnospiraceae bacterium]